MDAMNGMNPAAEKRAMLADHYDQETASRLQLAQFASDAGLKSATSHLLTLAGKSRRYAEQARKREQLHGILASVAASQDAQNPGNFFQSRMGMEPEAAAPDATMAAGGQMPGYAGGTGNMLDMLKNALGVGGGSYTGLGDLQNQWNRTPASQGVVGGASHSPDGGILELIQRLTHNRPMSAPGAQGYGGAPSDSLMRSPGYEPGRTPVPGYAGGTSGAWPEDDYAGGAPPGTHPGGPALVGEDGPEASSEGMLGMNGPEVRNLPPGATVAPNILTVIRMLLDIAEAGQGGDGQAEPAGGGYAYGTGAQRHGGGWFAGVPGYGAPAAPGGQRGYTGSGTEFRPGDIQGDDGAFNANQGLQSLIEHGANAGAYDPLGSEAAAGISKQAILGGMGARQAGAANMADIYAQGDPSFRAFARLKAQSDTQSEAARAYEQARAQQVAAAQGFSRDILGSQFGATLRKDPREANPLAAIGGQVAGTVLGAAVGGPAGAAVGGRMGGGMTGGSGPTDTPWYYGRR